MSNYDVLKSGIISSAKYQDLLNKVYGNEAYTRDDLVRYSNKLSFGFAGRCKLYFCSALASVGLISGARRDEIVAAHINGIAQTLIQQIGQDTGYYIQDRAQKVSLFGVDKAPAHCSKLPVDITKGVVSGPLFKDHYVRLDSDDPLEMTQALRIALAQRVQLPAKSKIVTEADKAPKASVSSEPVRRLPSPFSLPQKVFEGFPREPLIK